PSSYGDWSSDVCASDLTVTSMSVLPVAGIPGIALPPTLGKALLVSDLIVKRATGPLQLKSGVTSALPVMPWCMLIGWWGLESGQIGRASCRERGEAAAR